MRGEHLRDNGFIVCLQGSSPHARGALLEVVEVHHFLGIIPACAGSTLCAFECVCHSVDHPRMRGEHTLDR